MKTERATAPDEAWLVGLPKAEVHVHLEGGFDRADLLALAAAAGEALPRPEDELFAARDLPSLLRLLDWGCGLVRTSDQLARAAYRMAEREHRSGVGYADVIVNPTHWPAWQGRLEAFLAALDAGFTEAEQDGFTPTGLCVSLLRTQDGAEALEVVERLAAMGLERVVALSIDGDEAAARRTGSRFAPAFAAARAAGLHRTAHVGESSGPEGVWDAIDLLGVERIDHGVRAIEDGLLVAELARRRIHLGVCPTSNVVLSVVGSYLEHPLERLRQAGVPVSVNTDDPALLGTRLEWEYARIGAAAGWATNEYLAVARTSIEAAFCDEGRRGQLLRRLEAYHPEVES